MIRLGFDDFGLTHVPDEPPPVACTEAMCGTPFSDFVINVTTREVPDDTVLTCLQCVARFGNVVAAATSISRIIHGQEGKEDQEEERVVPNDLGAR